MTVKALIWKMDWNGVGKVLGSACVKILEGAGHIVHWLYVL